MKSYLAIGTGPAIAPAERFAKEESRTVLAFLSLLLLALILAMPNAHAEDRTKQDVSRGGEHPAVIVARRGVQVDPTSNFYLHPARLSWSLQRPTGEHQDPVDPTSKFYPHPAWLNWSLQRPTDEREEPAVPVAGGGRDSAKNPGPYVALDSRLETASHETR